MKHCHHHNNIISSIGFTSFAPEVEKLFPPFLSFPHFNHVEEKSSAKFLLPFLPRGSLLATPHIQATTNNNKNPTFSSTIQP
jgi:hypothetical protein